MATIAIAHALPILTGSEQVYQITYSDGTISFVPQNAQNADYAKLQAWLAAGGTLS